MYISRIKLVNWKNFQNCDVRLAKRAFIVGANATGKSNFLDAFRFLRDIVKQGGGLQSAVQERGGVTRIRCLAARIHNNIRIEVYLTDDESGNDVWKYDLEFKNVGGGFLPNQASIVEEVLYNFQTNKNVIHRGSRFEGETANLLLYTFMEQPTSPLTARLHNFFLHIYFTPNQYST